jgi:4-amino-4-deoxy-L-arabinose transferase-like glycosyltransferase
LSIKTDQIYLIAVIAVAFALRTAQLNSLPISLNLDEATNGLDALRLVELSQITPFLQSNFGRESLFFYIQGVGLQLFGISIYTLRFVSVLLGVLAIPLLYVVGCRLLKSRFVGMLAAAGLAVSYWHIFFSRMALRAIILPCVLLVLVWCFWVGWFGTDKKNKGYLALAGVLLGLSLYTYLAARVLLLLFGLFILIEIGKGRSFTQLKGAFIFFSTATVTVLPLALYFQQHPQAIGSRTQAISILASSEPIQTLMQNIRLYLQLHWWGQVWLGQWPPLNWLIIVGFLAGLLLCIFQLKEAAYRFLLLWWGLGTVPILFASQNWEGQTTILRSIVAWPATFLLAALGLVTIVNQLNKRAAVAFPSLQKQKEYKEYRDFKNPRSLVPTIALWIILLWAGLTSGYRYFYVWASTYNTLSDHPPAMARYLNRQTDQLTLTPLKFYTETVGNFLLRNRYPALENIGSAQLQTLVQSDRPMVFLLPNKSTAEAGFVLLSPKGVAMGPKGTAYLLPPLDAEQFEMLAQYSQTTRPLASIFDTEQEPIAHIYTLPARAPFLKANTLPAKTSIQASFANTILLQGYTLESSPLKPGDSIQLKLYQQTQGPINPNVHLFIHLFHVATGQRVGQINQPLTGILFSAYRWPVGVVVPGQYTFTLPPKAPDGVYRFEIGLYDGLTQERLPVTLAQGVVDDKVILGKLTVQQQPFPPPQISFTNLNFGQQIALQGIDFDQTELVQAGQTINLRLHWQALASLTEDYTVALHLVDEQANLVSQQDIEPMAGRYPTSWWDEGEQVIDEYRLPLPNSLQPGPYTLRIILYQAGSGQRLPVGNSSQDFFTLPQPITVSN